MSLVLITHIGFVAKVEQPPAVTAAVKRARNLLSACVSFYTAYPLQRVQGELHTHFCVVVLF